MGFPRQEYWSELSLPSPGDLQDPRIKPWSCALAGEFFTTELIKYIVYSTIRKKERMPFAATHMDLEIIILSEVSQKKKDKYHTI